VFVIIVVCGLGVFVELCVFEFIVLNWLSFLLLVFLLVWVCVSRLFFVVKMLFLLVIVWLSMWLCLIFIFEVWLSSSGIEGMKIEVVLFCLWVWMKWLIVWVKKSGVEVVVV